MMRGFWQFVFYSLSVGFLSVTSGIHFISQRQFHSIYQSTTFRITISIQVLFASHQQHTRRQSTLKMLICERINEWKRPKIPEIQSNKKSQRNHKKRRNKHFRFFFPFSVLFFYFIPSECFQFLYVSFQLYGYRLIRTLAYTVHTHTLSRSHFPNETTSSHESSTNSSSVHTFYCHFHRLAAFNSVCTNNSATHIYECACPCPMVFQFLQC